MNLKFFFALFGLILLFGCVSNDSTAGNSVQTPILNGNNSEQSIPKTSLDNIYSAYSSGEISKPDYIFYSLEALYEPEKLPGEYSGEPFVNYDITDEIMLAIENWDELSSDQQEKISKWIALPDTSESETVILAEKGATVHFSGGPQLLSIDAVSGKAKVYGVVPSNATAAEKANVEYYMSLVKMGLEDAWPKFMNMLALEPNQTVYVFVKDVPPGTLGSAAIYQTTGDPVERCRLQIDQKQTVTDKKTKSVTAHELFHCFQYHIPLNDWGNQDQKWIKEATATWSENVVYPSYNREWDFLDVFFISRDGSLVQMNGNKAYSDYLFFKFLEQTGDEWDVIKVLLNAKNNTKNAVMGIDNYNSKFADFAAWNWNKDIMKKYTDDPSFPNKEIGSTALQTDSLFTQQETAKTFTYGAGSAVYHDYKIPEGTDVKKIQFSFKSPGSDQLQRRALVNIGGNWEIQDWTYLMNRQFCLDKPEEKVQEIVLIISNSNLNSEEFNPFDYDVDTTGECPFEISGTTKITYTIDEQSSEAGATGGTTMSGTFTSADVLWYDKEEEAYKIKSRTISCVYNEHTNAQDALYGFDSTRSGSGTTTEEYDEISEAPLKIRFDENDNNIDFFVYPDYQNPDWVSYTSTVTTTISGAGSTTQTFSEMDSCTFVSAMDYLTELEMSEFDGHRISGTRTFSHGGTSSIVEYDYTLSR